MKQDLQDEQDGLLHKIVSKKQEMTGEYYELDTLDFFYRFVLFVTFVVSKTKLKYNGLMRTYKCCDVPVK